MLKKTLFSIITLGILSFGLSWAASSLQSTMDYIVHNINWQWRDLTVEQQIDKNQEMDDFLKKIDYKLNSKQKAIAGLLRISFQNKIIELWWEPSEITNNENNYTNVDYTTTNVDNVDMDEVLDTWIQWHNDKRTEMWLTPYWPEVELSRTSYVWAKHLSELGEATHSRKPSDASSPWGYNFDSMQEWFTNQGVTFKRVSGAPFTEHTGRWYYKCTKSDCTQYMINQIKSLFDYYWSEASYDGPHYRGIVHPYFRKVGLWIVVEWTKFRMVSHYGTEVID